MYRGSLAYHSFVLPIGDSDAGRWKTLGVPVVIGVDNLPSPVRIGLTDLTNIGGPVAKKRKNSKNIKVAGNYSNI